MEKEQIAQGFIRQRRNLLIISLVLTFAQAANLTLTKLNLFGNEVNIGSPFAIFYALWVGWLYWLWRFYTYSNSIGEKQILTVYQGHTRTWVGLAKQRQVLRDKALRAKFDAQGMRIFRASVHSVKRLSRFSYEVALDVYTQEKQPLQDAAPKKDAVRHTDTVNSVFSLSWARFRAWRHVIFSKPEFSEYVLPYLVAAVPVLYLLCRTAFSMY